MADGNRWVCADCFEREGWLSHKLLGGGHAPEPCSSCGRPFPTLRQRYVGPTCQRKPGYFHFKIREVATGIARIYAFENRKGTRSPYWWLEGNFGCDCNRRLEWLRAGASEPITEIEDDECPCNVGPNAYVFDWVDLDGVRFIENDKPTENAED